MQYAPTHVFNGFVSQKPKLFQFVKCQFGSGLFIIDNILSNYAVNRLFWIIY